MQLSHPSSVYEHAMPDLPMHSDFIEIICQLPEEPAKKLVDWWFAQNASAVTCYDAGNQPILEPDLQTTPFWSNVRVVALYPKIEAICLAQLVVQLKKSFPDLPYQVVSTRLERWNEAWKAHALPQHLGQGLWICSSAHKLPERAYCRDTIRLDPGLAFGTGQHATTRLCLEWIAHHKLTGKTVLDIGCGSGVLSIAALKCDAREVIACDIDPQALQSTQRNSVVNEIPSSKLELVWIEDPQCPEHYPKGPVDLLLANLVSEPLVQLAPVFLDRLVQGGHLLLSGLMREETEKVMAAYRPLIKFEAPKHREEWTLLVGAKTNSAF